MNAELTFNDLILDLPRPEYVSLPEGFLSSIAWRAFQVTQPDSLPSGKKIGFRFKLHAPAEDAEHFEIVETCPRDEVLEKFAKSLEKNGLQETGARGLLPQAVLESLMGTVTNNSKFVPAIPLTPAIAMLQNPVGLSGKANPPDLAEIFERIFAYGNTRNSLLTVAGAYANASVWRTSHDPISAALDTAVNESVWDSRIAAVQEDYEVKKYELSPFLTNTPFAWFSETWEKITSEAWVAGLPSRVWVDWATCILRTGFAMTYLWETCWYESLARQILNDQVDAENFLQRCLENMEEPLIWRGSDAPAEIRDLSSKLKWRCYRSVEIRAALEKWGKDNSAGELSIKEFILAVRSDAEILRKLEVALAPKKDNYSGSAKNLWEAIRYSLKTRDSGDYYGFLLGVGTRYLFPAPGTEWGAMIASMSSRSQGLPTNLGEVTQQVSRMGISVQSKVLLGLLERTGLARGSADADLALSVDTAYSRGVQA